MLETGFVTHSEYQKHIRGEWRTVHDLWRHIRNYMTDYAQPGGFTQGSIPFADATGFLTENNTALFWDAVGERLGLGTNTPQTIFHMLRTVESGAIRLTANVRPWLQLESADGDWGAALGIDANDKKFHIHYDTPIGNEITCMFVFDGQNTRVGILEDAPAYPFDVGGNTRIQGILTVNSLTALTVTGATSLQNTLGVTGLATFADNMQFSMNDARIAFIAATGGIGYEDTGAVERWALYFPGGDQVVLCNRAANGTVYIKANTAVAGGGGEVLVGTFEDDLISFHVDFAIKTQKELRFYDNGNYVGFEAPALAADQIWVLPAADADAANKCIKSDGVGNLGWSQPLGIGNNPTFATLFLASIKSGADQAGAGAAANELYKTLGHASLPDNVVMIGV